MKFSIITPSLNQLPYLKRCVASVADQLSPLRWQKSEDRGRKTDNLISDLRSPIAGRSEASFHVHHHVQDAGSDDGTVEFLKEYTAGQSSTPNYQLTFASESDEGMYDALNKGLSLASGDIIAWLNCDEQYLPGTLSKVENFFDQENQVDLTYGDALLIASSGKLLTFRKNPPLRRAYVLADHLYTQSASMFFRAEIFRSGLRFNTEWKAVGDSELVEQVLGAGFCAGQIRDYLSACTMTGNNLSCRSAGPAELAEFRGRSARRYRIGRPFWNTFRYIEKWMRGGYCQTVPFSYALYIDSDNERRVLTEWDADFRFRWGSDDA